MSFFGQHWQHRETIVRKLERHYHYYITSVLLMQKDLR